MNTLIIGSIECTKCKHKFKWHYIVPQPLSSNLIAASIPNNSRGVKVIREVGDKKYLFQTRCYKCDELLEFEQEVDEKIKYF